MLKNGRLIAHGPPLETLTPAALKGLYGVDVAVTYVEALGHSGDAKGIEAVIDQRRGDWPEVDSFWSFIVSIHLANRDFKAARDALTKLIAFIDGASEKFPEKDLQSFKGLINDIVNALESGDKTLIDKVAAEGRSQLLRGQAEAQQALHLLSWLGLADEAMKAAETLYVDRGFGSERSPSHAIPSHYPYGRPTTAPLLSHDGIPLQRDRRIWIIFAKIGLAKYWMDSGQWPDFCSEPSLGYDCREEAGKALEALKIN